MKKSGQCFLTSFRRLTTAIFPLASEINFLLLWNWSILYGLVCGWFHPGLSANRAADLKHWNSSLRKKEGPFWCLLVGGSFVLPHRCDSLVSFLFFSKQGNRNCGSAQEEEINVSLLLFFCLLKHYLSQTCVNMRWRNDKGCWQGQKKRSTVQLRGWGGWVQDQMTLLVDSSYDMTSTSVILMFLMPPFPFVLSSLDFSVIHGGNAAHPVICCSLSASSASKRPDCAVSCFFSATSSPFVSHAPCLSNEPFVFVAWCIFFF